MEGLGFRSARALGFGRGVEEHSAADALWIVLVVIDGDCCDCGVAERAGWIVSGVRRVLVVGADADQADPAQDLRQVGGIEADAADHSANGDVGNFNGKMALFRYYDGKAFNADEVMTNFLALSSGGSVAAHTDW